MTEQRKLMPFTDEPNVDLDGAVDNALVTEREEYLPPLPAKTLPPPEAPEPEVQGRSGEMSFIRRISAVILVLMTGSLAGFVAGAGVGVLLFTGALDIDSTWIKNVVNIFRGN